jgi:hypothetical protein
MITIATIIINPITADTDAIIIISGKDLNMFQFENSYLYSSLSDIIKIEIYCSALQQNEVSSSEKIILDFSRVLYSSEILHIDPILNIKKHRN